MITKIVPVGDYVVKFVEIVNGWLKFEIVEGPQKGNFIFSKL